MIDALILFAAGFVQVFALGFQSRNVNTGQYSLAAIFSFGIGLSQAVVWSKVAGPGGGPMEALIYSVSGAIAIVCAMWVHRRFVHKGKDK